MHGRKTKGLLSFIFLLLVFLLIWGSLGFVGEPVYLVNPSIVIMPNAVDTKGGKLEIRGAGFTPGSQVTVGFPYLAPHKKLPRVRGLWLGVAIVGEGGAFSIKVDLRQSLGRLVGRKVMIKEKVLGVHTFMGKNGEGEIATVLFVVMEAGKK